MTETQSVKIAQLEAEVQELKSKVDELDALRNRLLGMGWATGLALKIIISLIGVGGLAACARLIMWLSQPIKH